MEEFESKKYRDNLAKELKESRKNSPALAQYALKDAQRTEEYEKAKKNKIKAVKEHIIGDFDQKSESDKNLEYANWVILEKEASPDMTTGGNDYLWDPAWEFQVQRNEIKKSVQVSEEEYKKYNVGETINLKLEEYEKEDYVEEVRNKISESDTFESLETAVKTIGDLKGYKSFYPLYDMLEDIKLMKKGEDPSSGYFYMSEDIYGFAKKALELKEDVLKKKKETRNATFLGKIINKIKGE